ncbi:pyridoxal-dependent decarboxylase [Jiulongibacter sediminis]|uniref:Cytochrome D ubiquinol oxidase subunit I n=1 Tax=Jiulongibacter sediminis TaxID=1605367 RepID=A0A0P7C836_9BACT|nr:pyridoxal-dependent decarboxylase [Jiulongibacter sediminis]KPM48632.1 cytochrome D ubiquinol oxidase subunit I [Jiulongibacter sediminis]TBX25169.1 cytochrome D ubiquinol oxidase subunit I [Jiulongibacter sediminis]
MKLWKKKSHQEILDRVKSALDQNRSFYKEPILGMPCSYLDSKIFPGNSPILANAPFLQTLVNNPNHIGCHTVATSEATFEGTQQLERELLDIIACDIFKAEHGNYDGYVATGGTESNIQALWIYREYFKAQGLSNDEIAVVCSEDTHYSISKGCNLLCLNQYKVKVDPETRKMALEDISAKIKSFKDKGMKGVVFVANMMTTMFGSVDDIDVIATALQSSGLDFKIHVDSAYGGFYYPFINVDTKLDFSNPLINSITVDAHKMVQAPYGTGIFLIRKGFMKYTLNQDASYVKGEDYTLVGSRSGANSVAVWMILTAHGPHGWSEKVYILKKRTDWLCQKLKESKINFFREKKSNIVTIPAKHVNPKIEKKYYLVPDSHSKPSWYKIIVMEHVSVGFLESLVEDLSLELAEHY